MNQQALKRLADLEAEHAEAHRLREEEWHQRALALREAVASTHERVDARESAAALENERV